MPEESEEPEERVAGKFQFLANYPDPSIGFRGVPNMDDVAQWVPPQATSIQAPPPPELPFLPVKPYRRGGRREEEE